VRLVQEANINAVLTEELFHFQLPATNTITGPISQPQCLSPVRLSEAAQTYSAIKRITVLSTARRRASPVGREEAAERRQRVNSTQALLGRFLRRSAIPSSGD
jgi:hypothetical protein